MEIITIREDTKIPGTDVILEKGDKIQMVYEWSPQLLLEMPHIQLGGKPFDVEIEAHLKDEDELHDYFYSVLSGEVFSYKYGDNVQLSLEQRKELKQFLLTDPYMRLVFIKQYSQKVYDNFLKRIASLKL